MDDRKQELSHYRMEKASICLNSAKILAATGDYCGAANRSYYAIFHCVRSILALDGMDFSKHSGIIAYFQKNYVKTGVFGKEYSKILTEAFTVRSESDYDDYYVISKDDIDSQIRNAESFIIGIQCYVESRISNDKQTR